MAYMVRKTVMIGLGGTGRDAVLQCKRKLLEVYGETPPTCKFLCFDTTDPPHSWGRRVLRCGSKAASFSSWR
ncbi:MAG: hypothetical protein FJX76_06360 [Armatimonadetes bacterium]|nr:hypothetical protein [Armatimonadota bacterium]